MRFLQMLFWAIGEGLALGRFKYPGPDFGEPDSPDDKPTRHEDLAKMPDDDRFAWG